MRILQSEHPRPLDVLAVGAGGHVAAASSLFGAGDTVEVWDPAFPGPPRHVHRTAEAAVSLAFTPDGRFLLVAELRSVTVFDVHTGERRPGPVVRLGHPLFALSADGRLLLVREAWNGAGRLVCWDVSDGPAFHEAWHEVPHPHLWYDAPAVSADGRRVAVVRRPQYGDRPQQTIQVRDAADGRVRHETPHDAADPVLQLAFTADGTRLLARLVGRSVLAFDAESGAPAGELRHPGRPFVTGLAVHPGGGAVATSRNDGTVWFWDPAALLPLRWFDWKAGKLVSVAFSPDGSLAAAGTDRGQVVVWDVDE